jgi:hypothetical protein
VFEVDPLRCEVASRLVDIFKAAGVGDTVVAKKVADYRAGSIGGSTFHTMGRVEGFDYIIMLPANSGGRVWPAPFFAPILGEEVAHGEHDKEHAYEGKRLFSDTAAEFIGRCGFVHAGRALCNRVSGADKPVKFKFKTEILRPRYDQATNMYYYDIGHTIGYQIADQTMDLIPHADVFHAPSEKVMWALVNEHVTPEITLPVPHDLDNKYRVFNEIQGALKSEGLTFTMKMEEYARDEINTG